MDVFTRGGVAGEEMIGVLSLWGMFVFRNQGA
jgi:hypothetical protein